MLDDAVVAPLEDHPGYLGITSQGVIAIHAEWPIYPEEHGPGLALLWLTAFPRDTLFKKVDDIDRCVLLLADVRNSKRSDPFDRRSFHVAVWHEDLLELATHGFVVGVSAASERRWHALRQAEDFRGAFYVLDDGERRVLDLSLDDYDEEGNSWPELTGEGIRVTPAGRSQATQLLSEAPALNGLGNRVEDLMRSGYFDTAVREACVDLEHRMKVWLRSEAWGDGLAEEFIEKLRDEGAFIESYLRVLRGQIRGTFKYIRNDFMHNFVEVDETQARAILFRVSRVRSAVERVTSD